MARTVREITVIVGAGVSVPSGAPDYRALRDRYLQLADPTLDVEAFAVGDLSPEQVFDALDDGREELRAAVRRQLWWLCETGEPNSNHFATAALVYAGAHVWTPNFDTMIERAAARSGRPLQVVVPGDDLESVADAATVLFKPHGSFPYAGDPPTEPSRHDYDLLFQASRVWLLDEAWGRRLLADLDGRDIYVFGYRGADPDLTPILLQGFERSRSVTWWEFEDSPNFQRLQRLLSNLKQATITGANPSEALQEFGREFAPYQVTAGPPTVPLTPPSIEMPLSYFSRAQVIGQLRGARVARSYLLKASFLDPPELRSRARFHFLRSVGYDVWWARGPLLVAVRLLERVRTGKASSRLLELEATWLYVRPLRSRDPVRLRTLMERTSARDAELLIRLASKEKLAGELRAAADDLTEALGLLQHDAPDPRLEAMAVYNLAWTYRQQAAFEKRDRLVAEYAERMPHIGFNWASWLVLENVFAALNRGETKAAREYFDGPFLRYARSLIGHPMFRVDDSAAIALLAWHERGPAGADVLLRAPLRHSLTWPFSRASFSTLDAWISLADHARSMGDHELMASRLRLVARRTQSPLQRVKVQLVAAVAAQGASLEALEAMASAHGFGLIAQTAAAASAYFEGSESMTSTPVAFRPFLPLAGVY